jgi:diadenosine tetraphosphate (Ap4A) HIT family hydrolase
MEIERAGNATVEALKGDPKRVFADILMDCIFCHLDRSILAESKLSCAVPDGYPVSKGHSLVFPKRHVASIWEMTEEEYTDVFSLIRQVKDIL